MTSLLVEKLRALSRGVPHSVTVLANAAALLWEELDRINWAGFYFLEKDVLYLGPFQGKAACVRIPLGMGVCGTAARENKTLAVPDVHAFPGHIACDAASRSELVIPLHKNGALWGVLDLDSPFPARFSPEDQKALEAFARELEQFL